MFCLNTTFKLNFKTQAGSAYKQKDDTLTIHGLNVLTKKNNTLDIVFGPVRSCIESLGSVSSWCVTWATGWGHITF